jgi:hypothetical protein
LGDGGVAVSRHIHFQHAVGKGLDLEGVSEHSPDDFFLFRRELTVSILLFEKRAGAGLDDIDRILQIVDEV